MTIAKSLLKGTVLALSFIVALLLIDKYKDKTEQPIPLPDQTYIISTNNITINPTFELVITNQVNVIIEKLELNYYTNCSSIIKPVFNNNGVASLIITNVYYPQTSQYYSKEYTEPKWHHKHQISEQ